MPPTARRRAGSLLVLPALAAGCLTVLTAAPAGAQSGDCRDWWTITDRSRTVFRDADESVTFWGRPSCTAPTTPQYWTALYRPDEASDYRWATVKTKHAEGRAIAYGFEMTRRNGAWVAVGFADSHG